MVHFCELCREVYKKNLRNLEGLYVCVCVCVRVCACVCVCLPFSLANPPSSSSFPSQLPFLVLAPFFGLASSPPLAPPPSHSRAVPAGGYLTTALFAAQESSPSRAGRRALVMLRLVLLLLVTDFAGDAQVGLVSRDQLGAESAGLG